MAEVVAGVASIVAIIQISDRIIGACRSYFDSFQDYPKDLRLIYVETASIKVVLESLTFLDKDDPEDFATLQALGAHDGPVEACMKTMQELSGLLPHALPQFSTKKTKKQKLGHALTILAWPMKSERAHKLLNEITQYKSTISLALAGELL